MSLLDTASLIVTPNGYKEGKLYSVIPSDGSGDLSVTRATTATRVNSAGLVELVPYNLLQYSQDFSNAAYNKIDIQTVTTGITDPNGGTTGVRLIPFVGFNGVVTQSFSTAIGSTYTLTFWMKGNANGVLNVNYNGAVLSPQNNVSYTTQWQQFQYVFTADSNSSQILFGGFFTWASGQQLDFTFAQVNEGSTALPYQKTETRLNIPRLDYSNGTCPSILVEPQRTNLLDYSSSFDSGFWLTFNASISGNTTISPSGVQDADTLTSSATTGGSVYRLINTSGTQTISCFFKAGTSNVCNIGFSNGWYAEYNLSNQTYTTVGTVTASMEDYGNGWYRCIITADTTSTLLGFGNSGTTGTTVFIWGAQAEAGSYATSYIPTTSASVTRNADVISKTGISSLIGQTEGTFFLDMYYDGVSSNYALMQTFQNASQFNVIQLTISPTKRLAFEVGNDAAILAPSALVAGRYKIAGAYKNNDFVLYLNGDLIGTDTSGAVIATDAITFNDYFAIPSIYKQVVEINSAALWKTRLTNTQLAQLTTI